MKKFISTFLFSLCFLAGCSTPPVSKEVMPTVSIYVNSAEETAQKIIEAVPNAKVTQKKEDGIMTLALDYEWEETDKIDQLLTENSTDGNIFGAKQMTGILQEEEDALKAQNPIRLIVNLTPVALLEVK